MLETKKKHKIQVDLKKCEFVVNYLYMGFLFRNDDIKIHPNKAKAHWT